MRARYKNHKVTHTLTIALVITVVFPIAATGQSVDSILRLAIIGDRTGEHVPGIYGQIVTEIERLKPDLVMTVGDMIEGYPNDSLEISTRWREYDSLVAPLCPPIYYTPGNNDIWSDLSERLYRQRIGRPYYSFDFGNTHFVILDNSRWDSSEQLPREQIDWLINDLQQDRETNFTTAFYHKPFWYKSTALGKPDTLHSLFVHYGVDAVFCGHYHEYFSGEYDGISYTCIGSSGGGTHASARGLGYHFAWVTIDRQGIRIAPITMGSVLPWDYITADNKRAFDRIKNFSLSIIEPLLLGDDLKIEKNNVVVRLDNSYSEFELDDTLRWDIPENWNVEPDRVPVKIAAGESKTIEFAAQCTGALYPVPTARVDFTYLTGETAPSTSPLRLARQVYGHRASSPPKIDGRLDEDFWLDPEKRLFGPGGGDAGTDPVEFYFAYDRDHLYLGARCYDLVIDSLVAGVTDHDGSVYAEDCLGYFIEPIFGSDTAYQIYFNPLGTVYDVQLTRDDQGWMDYQTNWDGIYDVKTVRGEDSWSIEVQIPTAQFGVQIKSGQKWRLNFRRKHKRLNTAADWQSPISGDPDTYGYMIMK